MNLASLGRAALPVVAIAAFVVIPGAVVWAGAMAGTLGFDFLAYHQAGERVLAGERLYDPSVQQTGGFGLFYYPPPFVLGILPFALLPGDAATWLWLGLSVAMLVVAIAILPVRTSVRWATLLLAGLCWPVAYALKLGQVGPLLLLLFAIGWRWLDRPGAVGLTGALGAIVKIQPGIVLAWALLARRWREVVVGAVIVAVASAIATAVAGGPSIWTDYLTLLRNVSDPIATPHNFTPGATAYQLGVPTGVATTIQLVSSVAVAGAVVVAALRATQVAGYLVAVIASQLLSPVLWDHYAMLLLLPVAWLLDRGQWWAAAIPLATTLTLLLPIPAAVYPAAFWVALVAVLWLGLRDRAALEPAR